MDHEDGQNHWWQNHDQRAKTIQPSLRSSRLCGQKFDHRLLMHRNRTAQIEQQRRQDAKVEGTNPLRLCAFVVHSISFFCQRFFCPPPPEREKRRQKNHWTEKLFWCGFLCENSAIRIPESAFVTIPHSAMESCLLLQIR